MKNLKPHLITIALGVVAVIVAAALITKKDAAGNRVFKSNLLNDKASAAA